MKKQLSVLITILACSIALSAQSTSKSSYIVNKSYFTSKGLVYVPSGSYTNAEGETRSVQAFFMSNEISNKEFRAFADEIVAHPDSALHFFERQLQGIEQKTITYADIKKQLIDSAAMLQYFINQPTKQIQYKNYFSDKRFDNYPVVGVSAQTAKYYCIWKTKQELATLTKSGKGLINDFRIPLQEELDYVCSFTPLETPQYNSDVTEVNKGNKNLLDIYHLFDNVEELTSNSESNEINAPKGFRMVCTYLGR